jgi:UDP-glucuronate decarboxylase
MMDTKDHITGPVNLGNPKEYTILELAEKIIQMTGSSSKIKYEPLPEDDPVQRQPDISKAKQLLNTWEPKIGIEEGLDKTIHYFKKIISS